jgi:hypothetical protein
MPVSAAARLPSPARACLAAAAALLLGACAAAPPPAGTGAPAPAPPAAAAPAPVELPRLTPTSPPANLGSVERFAWQRVVEFGDAFAAGDVDGFLGKVSRGFYRGYTALEASLRELLLGSRARTAVVEVRAVTTEEGRVSVRARWTRSVTRPDGTIDAKFGETVFLFLKSDTSLRLLDYQGDAPFGIAGI